MMRRPASVHAHSVGSYSAQPKDMETRNPTYRNVSNLHLSSGRAKAARTDAQIGMKHVAVDRRWLDELDLTTAVITLVQGSQLA